MKTFLITLTALGLTTAAAFAQAEAPSFATADADASGDVTLVEAQVLWADLTQDIYDAADTDKSGSLNQAEFDAYVATLPAPAAQ